MCQVFTFTEVKHVYFLKGRSMTFQWRWKKSQRWWALPFKIQPCFLASNICFFISLFRWPCSSLFVTPDIVVVLLKGFSNKQLFWCFISLCIFRLSLFKLIKRKKPLIMLFVVVINLEIAVRKDILFYSRGNEVIH